MELPSFSEILVNHPTLEVQICEALLLAVFWWVIIKIISQVMRAFYETRPYKESAILLNQITLKNRYFLSPLSIPSCKLQRGLMFCCLLTSIAYSLGMLIGLCCQALASWWTSTAHTLSCWDSTESWCNTLSAAHCVYRPSCPALETRWASAKTQPTSWLVTLVCVKLAGRSRYLYQKSQRFAALFAE